MFDIPSPLVAFLATCARGVQLIVVIGIRDVQLIWIDTNDGSISVLQISDVDGVLAAKDDVVLEFIPFVLRSVMWEGISCMGGSAGFGAELPRSLNVAKYVGVGPALR